MAEGEVALAGTGVRIQLVVGRPTESRAAACEVARAYRACTWAMVGVAKFGPTLMTEPRRWAATGPPGNACREALLKGGCRAPLDGRGAGLLWTRPGPVRRL